MQKSVNTEPKDQTTSPKEPEAPPLIVPPKDPPETEEYQRNKMKSISIDTSTKEAMLITAQRVEMIATPQIAYKIIRVVNHFIKHIIENYNDEMSVASDTIWYKKWQSVYSIMRSSRRTMIDNYRLLFDDYTTKDNDVSTYTFVMALIEYVPHLKQCYDINPIEGLSINRNKFHLIITLYSGKIKDKDNPFAPLEEASLNSSFKPFTENKSIATWHTNITRQSSESNQMEQMVPDDVVVDKKQQADDNSQVTTASNPDNNTPDKSKESGLSYSTTTYNPGAKKIVTFTKKQHIIKDEIVEECNKEINKNMEELSKSLKGMIIQQQNILQTLVSNQSNSFMPQTPTMSNPPITNNPPTTRNPPPTTPSNPNISTSINPNNSSSSYRPHKSFASPQQRINTSQSNNNQFQYQRSGSVIFNYNGQSYELHDSQYAKNSSDLRKVTNSVDLVHYYEEMQSEAIAYNIFLQQFDMLKPWDKYVTNSLPPTCIFDYLTANDNTIDAYNRMKNALYAKISKSEIEDPEYKAIIKHGSIGKDGFEVLYDLMTLCHPKLMVATSKIRDTNERPHLEDNESIYEFAEKITTWLTIEQIEGVQHSDDKILNIFMAEMRKYTKYDLAVQSIASELTIKDTLNRRTGVKDFPEHLKLYHLPSTVISYYSKTERNQLFPPEESNSTDGTAIVNRGSSTDLNNYEDMANESYSDIAREIIEVANDITEAKVMLARQGVDQNCEGCGMYGHDVFKTGCDRCAQYILIKRYLEKNPGSEKSILFKYRKHQKQLAEKRRSRTNRKESTGNTNSERKPRHRYNTKYNKAKIQRVQEAIMAAVATDSNESDDESYASANMESTTQNSQE